VTKKTLAIKEKFIVMQYIELHCVKAPDHKYAMWDSIAENDQHVADLHKPSIPNINAAHVRGMRQKLELFLEPSRIMAKTSIDILSAKVEQLEYALTIHATSIKAFGEFLTEHNKRLEQLEEKYTRPTNSHMTEYVDASTMIFGSKPITRWLDNAADKAVAAIIDPLTEKNHPVKPYRRGKHSGR
jgi:hypothetical protein